MIKKTYKLTIDLKNGIMNYNVVNFITEDKGCNSLEITLLDSATQYNLTGNTTRFVAKTPSGAILQQNCTNKGGNVITIDLNQSFFTEQGIHTGEVQIYDTANQTLRVTFPSFKYHVTKSLMNDDNIQADSNFTILQDMIHNVQNADRVSTEALETANEAKAIVDTLVPKTNQAAQNAQEALDRAESVVTQEELADKITIGAKKANFKFIENQVEQDGLIDKAEFKSGSQLKRIDVQSSNKLTFCFKLDVGIITNRNLDLYKYSNSNNRSVYIFKYGMKIYVLLEDLIDKTKRYCYISKDDVETSNHDTFVITCDLENLDYVILKNNEKIEMIPNSFRDGKSTNGKLVICENNCRANKFESVIYNMYIEPSKIQHNFSVLNNSPSIKEVHTTDSEGKTSILKFASDTDHVTDRSGRTQDEINRTFYKRSCKEIPSPNGEPVTVNNGEEGYVLSAEIKGQTVKNYCPTNTVKKQVRFGNDTYAIYSGLLELEASKKYRIRGKITDCVDETKEILFSVNSGNNPIGKTAAKNGYFDFEFTMPSTYSSGNLWIYHAVTGVTLLCNLNEVMVLEAEHSDKVNSYIPFGLSSTQAVISNSGQSNYIYEPTIQGKTKILNAQGVEVASGTAGARLVSLETTDSSLPKLGGVPSIGDKLNLASLLITKNIHIAKLVDVMTTWTKTIVGTNTTRWYCGLNPARNSSSIIQDLLSDSIKISSDIVNIDEISLGTYGNTSSIHIRVPNSLSTDAEVKDWIRTNYPNTEICYWLATPQEIQLTEKQLAAYDKHKKIIVLNGI